MHEVAENEVAALSARVAEMASELDELRAALRESQTAIRELQDVREIKAVWDKWHFSCTGGFNGKQAGRMEALECLSDDATIECENLHGAGEGPTGREECRQYWEYFYGDEGPLPYVFQTSLADDITVDGDTAIHKSNMLGIFHARGDGTGLDKPTMIGLWQRTNHCVRTPEGWRIRRTTMDGGLSIGVDNLQGALNALPEKMADRTAWSR